MNIARIFVIHSEADDKILKRVVCEYDGKTFGKYTLRIRFVDSKEGSKLGKDFGKIVSREIKTAKYALAIVSPNSETSVWLNQEIGYARGINKEIVLMKEESMARKGLGFIHSNIDAQLFRYRQRRFHKLEKFFKKKFRKTSTEALKAPLVIKPTSEDSQTTVREAEPYVD
jgi:hypothetical protein